MMPASEPRDAPLILIVDDEKLMRLHLHMSLQQAGYQVVAATHGGQALELYQHLHPDIVLMDAVMPVMDGFTCCAQLQNLSERHPAPVLMITGLEDKSSVDRAFEAGAADYITKPIHWAVLLQRVRRLIQQSRLQREQETLYQQLAEANRVLQGLVFQDGLTGVANRRRFDEYLLQEWQRMAREQQPLSLILTDIDHFKAYNDTYGHQAGDDCLKQVAQAVESVAKRTADLVARYGGEELAVILPNTALVGALTVAEEIREQVAALHIRHSRGVNGWVTLSAGVASLIPNPLTSPDFLINSADKALYHAKANGRNCSRIDPHGPYHSIP